MREFLNTPVVAEFNENSVALLGTINGSLWRDALIPKLDTSYYNPVVEDWTADDRTREEQAKAACGILLYAFTPKLKGQYTMAEFMTDVFTRPDKRIVVLVLAEDAGETFDEDQLRSIERIRELVGRHRDNVAWFNSIDDLAMGLYYMVKPAGASAES